MAMALLPGSSIGEIWQGYNYGNGYISWALEKFGDHSEANALQFSQEQAAAHGWSGYGDPEYVPHVMRYYSRDTDPDAERRGLGTPATRAAVIEKLVKGGFADHFICMLNRQINVCFSAKSICSKIFTHGMLLSPFGQKACLQFFAIIQTRFFWLFRSEEHTSELQSQR